MMDLLMGEEASACIRATMKFAFERLSCLLLTYAIRFKPQAISVALSVHGSKGAMYHGSMLVAGMLLKMAHLRCQLCVD
jgi:hypothetical protein